MRYVDEDHPYAYAYDTGYADALEQLTMTNLHEYYDNDDVIAILEATHMKNWRPLDKPPESDELIAIVYWTGTAWDMIHGLQYDESAKCFKWAISKTPLETTESMMWQYELTPPIYKDTKAKGR